MKNTPQLSKMKTLILKRFSGKRSNCSPTRPILKNQTKYNSTSVTLLSKGPRGWCLLPLLGFVTFQQSVSGQVMEKMWDTAAVQQEQNGPDTKWFRDAKFGLFIHWGLYSTLGNEWKGKNYYGSGEWIMNRAKIPAAEYAKLAAKFNPVDFNATAWATFAKNAGIKYLVITAKHHEGFAMFNSKASDFNIVKATPYKKDLMKALSDATRAAGIKFGFYYSQFVDWHEPNGGGNSWDFDTKKKDYALYYKQKAIPQLKELLTGYGPLGLIWFDLPGGLTKDATKSLVDSLHALQPSALFSSRVGQGLGDYKDFGDSEVPDAPIDGPWEAIFTHNNSWGYVANDMDFKTPKEIIQLLAEVASKGGNLMLNVGPDGKGNIPAYSKKYLLKTGEWLQKNGESIYGTTYGFVPGQPWGVTTAKPGKLFLHVFTRPDNNVLLVPGFTPKIKKVYTLIGHQALVFDKKGADLLIHLDNNKKQSNTAASDDQVLVVEYEGAAPAYPKNAPITVSPQFDHTDIGAVHAKMKGNAKVKSITYSHYWGDWKHTSCVIDMKNQTDAADFTLRITEKGDYKIVLVYACPKEDADQEGIVNFNGQDYLFRSIRTGAYDSHHPLMFISQDIAVTTITTPGDYHLTIKPRQEGNELLKLQKVVIVPVK
ncbi:MAG TPA: alpha-L-fucosidase [Arachidicoccus sp.]|nr:alpha-L-fucosidase [Arachidicoccus sp.]